MVIVKNTTSPQRVYIPKAYGKSSVLGGGVLHLVCTTDRKEYDIPVIDMSLSGLYCLVSVTLEEGMASGEYEYVLTNDELEDMSRGILVLTPEGVVVPHSYEQTIQYEQYS